MRIVEGLSGTLAQWVLSDAVDFAICSRPAAALGLSLRLLVTDRLVLVSAQNSRRVPFAPYRLRDIADLKLVLPSANHFLRHTLDHHIHRGDFRPATTLEIDGQSATLQFVAHSDWSTILPTIALIHEFHSGRFCMNPIEDPPLSTEIYELRSPRHTPTEASPSASSPCWKPRSRLLPPCPTPFLCFFITAWLNTLIANHYWKVAMNPPTIDCCNPESKAPEGNPWRGRR